MPLSAVYNGSKIAPFGEAISLTSSIFYGCWLRSSITEILYLCLEFRAELHSRLQLDRMEQWLMVGSIYLTVAKGGGGVAKERDLVAFEVGKVIDPCFPCLKVISRISSSCITLFQLFQSNLAGP
jgi:hypothetical protein